MTGPGGMGQAEVAVRKTSEPLHLVVGDKQRSALGSFFHSVASLLLDDGGDDNDGQGQGGRGRIGGETPDTEQHQQHPALSTSTSTPEMHCALMHLMLPVGSLAKNILESVA